LEFGPSSKPSLKSITLSFGASRKTTLQLEHV
jgi:hypothetical protein